MPPPGARLTARTGPICWCATATRHMEAERCSTGEQKALLVGLILAHARLVGNLTGHAPILLLDEIAAHLDEGRRAALFDLIDELGGQAFMTGTDKAMFSALGERAQFFTVAHGGISKSGENFPLSVIISTPWTL